MQDFDFKKQCLFCCKPCLPKDPKHPGRWDHVIQCERIGIKDAPPFKSVVIQYCDDRNDVWGIEVAIQCHGVHDLGAAEAQYHLRCYDEFRKIPRNADQTPLIVDGAMKAVVDEMYENCQLCTWTSIELHEKYLSYGGQLECRQLFTNIATHFGDDVIVLSIEGCASVIGFHELLGKIIKVAKLDTQDEDKEDVLVRQIKMEAWHMSTDNKNYALEDFTYAKTMEQTSPTFSKIPLIHM